MKGESQSYQKYVKKFVLNNVESFSIDASKDFKDHFAMHIFDIIVVVLDMM